MLVFLEVIDDSDARDYFNKMYNDYHKMMFGCALGVLKNRYDAEDALQQVLLRLWKYIDNVRKVSPSKMGSYLCMTTKNYCISMLNKIQKKASVSVADFSEIEPVSENDPEIIAIKKYDFSLLMQAMDEINPNYRQLILDKTILHLSDEQAAEHIGIKPTYVRECLSRARASLRRNYAELLNSENLFNDLTE